MKMYHNHNQSNIIHITRGSAAEDLNVKAPEARIQHYALHWQQPDMDSEYQYTNLKCRSLREEYDDVITPSSAICHFFFTHDARSPSPSH